jgi:hypothetical protein
MKTDKRDRGTAHAIFDHSGSLEKLKQAIVKINNNPDSSQKARYELHHQASSGLELDVGLQDVLRTPDDYRVMNKDLRREYPPENRPLSDHKYILVARSEDGHERTAEELAYTMNQLHLLDDDPRIFRGGIVHKAEKEDRYNLIYAGN